MNREQLFRYFFLGVFIFLLFQILHVLSPFYTGILGAIVLTLIFFPLHRSLLKKIGQTRPNISAVLSTNLVMMLILIPCIFFSWILFNELTLIIPEIKNVGSSISLWRQGDLVTSHPFLHSIELRMQGLLDIAEVNLQEIVVGLLTSVVGWITTSLKSLPKNAFGLFINVLVMMFTMFFLFRDGPHLFHKFKELVPMDDRHKDLIANQLYLTVTGVVRGVFIVAVAQGTLAGFGFFIAGVPSPVFLGLCTIFTALIPLVGPAAIWLPVSVYYCFHGPLGKGIFLLIWGIFVISLIDNFLRPILIGSKARLPILFLFFGLLGGVKVYGPMGIFLGPLVVALLIAFVKIYREEYPTRPVP